MWIVWPYVAVLTWSPAPNDEKNETPSHNGTVLIEACDISEPAINNSKAVVR
jgi:hypothetical protein